ncbi:MAG: VCBS repeat-containing protein [Flavobacteriales bacterium]|nr:VCBS repeat-containing protein [Flavobacteriales bacterium]
MRSALPLLVAVAFPFAAAHSQSSCLTAMAVTPGTYATGAVDGSPLTASCAGGIGTAAIWYKYTATVDTMMQILTHVVGIPDTDTKVHVYSGTCAALTCIVGDDDAGEGLSSMVMWEVQAGTTYTIAFDNTFSSVPFSFILSMYYMPPPPAGVVVFTNTTIVGAGGIMGAVDMNNDGRDDAVMPGYTSFNIGYQYDMAAYAIANFPTTPAANTASWSFAVGDWDSNGHRDLLYGGGSGATFMNANATGSAYTQTTFPQYIFCQRTNFVDLNNDGNLDAFSCHDVDANVGFLNDGNGNLVFTQGGYGTTCGNYGSIFTDMNNDGSQDLFVAKCGCDPNDLMMPNNGTGMFTNVAVAQGLSDGHQSWSSAWADFDNDGDMDSFIGSSGGGVHKLLTNDGNGNFTNVTIGSGMDSFAGSSIEWTAHDFNNDGWVDILGGGAMHYNNGDMTFSHDATAPYNHAIGDMNNDGFLDILSSGGYFANGGNENNWVRINLVGVESNRDAIGARVKITSALGTQIRDIRSGDGFEFMSFIGAHFGLGEDTELEEVEVKWPSGAVEVFQDVAINSSHTYVEGVSVGMEDVASDGFLVAPNPVADVLVVSGIPMNAQVEVIDAAGKSILTDRLLGNDLDVNGLAPGVYQLRVIDGVRLRVARFVKR